MPFKEIKFKNLIFDPKVQSYCINDNFKCPNYNHSWACPPVAPFLEEKVSQFKKFFLIYYQFDLNSYVREMKLKHPKWSRDEIINRVFSKGITRKGLDMEIKHFLEEFQIPFQERLILLGGHCQICSDRGDGSCTFDIGEPCRYPDEMKYAMEAVGIDVDKTVKSLNFEIEWPPIRWIYRFGLICFR
jgi:predicted metal-binding protein